MIQVNDEAELSEINVTPFIDIMLVLLIIFMIVTPLITSSLHIDLPKASANMRQDDKKSFIVFVNNDAISLNDKEMDLDSLPSALDNLTHANKEEVIYFHVDKAVKYDRLMRVINMIKSNGYEKIALSGQIDDK
ncbi:MAG: biopolymer transporter ExbD [Helicobacter trogontum]|uniref:Biopolymer transporter ExbD n=1 Tax=Helicobacter trogontum TaxID=50960 RepID=A0ABQ0D3J4_9HELI|nr:biopolymer transporter ExbD [Helicobacter trogontum]MCI5786087.1 biopolymer transporter ExbD [Helicobacter trogontum]